MKTHETAGHLESGCMPKAWGVGLTDPALLLILADVGVSSKGS